MSAITDGPNEYDFGLDFNYALWTQGTSVTLVNVPWNNDYRDIVKFASRAALNSYINAKETSGILIENLSYVKPNMPIRIDVPFNRAYKYNYLRASNPVQPVDNDITKDYYYFILDARYVAPNTTEIIVQLDVWQTFGFDITFGNSYIERGHIGIANSKAFDNYGRDYLTIPEGIDIGNEYQVIATRKNSVMRPKITGNDGYDILVVSTVDLNADAGDVTAPNLESATGSIFTGIISGASFYLFSSGWEFLTYLTSMKEKPWITQGIISVTLIPKITRYIPGYSYSGNASGVEDYIFNPPANGIPTKAYNMFSNWRNASEILNKIPSRYRHLKKFFTYPYMAIEMTTWGGNPIVIKPEAWNDGNARVAERINIAPPNHRILFMPQKYNARSNASIDDRDSFDIDPENSDVNIISSLGEGDDNGEYLDFATNISGLPQVPVVNNGALGFLAANARSLAFQRNSADWSQQRALAGAQASYDNMNAGIDLTRALTAIDQGQLYGLNQQANIALTGQSGLALGLGTIGGIGGIAAGGGAGLTAGGQSVAGMVPGLISNTIAQNQMNNAADINARSAGQRGSASVSSQSSIRDTNKNLADWAAKGDYANTIAGINAKVQDAQLIQPSVSGQYAGETFNLVNDTMELSLRWKMIDPAAIRVLGEYWLRYGYAVRQFKTIPVSLQVMTKFTYWKLAETYISSATVPESFKQAIRGIFEKGVTVWGNANDIGNIDIANNEPISGVTL